MIHVRRSGVADSEAGLPIAEASSGLRDAEMVI